MTIIGCKKNHTGARKPSAKPATPRKGREAGKEAVTGYKAFMSQFKRQPCAVCGVKQWSQLELPTVGHHILYRSTHPEYAMTKENVIPLCVRHHVPFAHEKPSMFLEWLKEHRPEVWAWREEHNHHRRVR